MTIKTGKVYVDTNIYIYAILKHPEFGGSCATILRDIASNAFEAVGSQLVAIEILGSLASIDPVVARKATNDYVKSSISSLDITYEVLDFAGFINEKLNIRYDAVHAAVMLLNGISTIITNDVDDWGKFQKGFKKLLDLLKEKGFPVMPPSFEVVTPEGYVSWRKLHVGTDLG